MQKRRGEQVQQELVKRKAQQEKDKSVHTVVTQPAIKVLEESRDNKDPIEVTLRPYGADSTQDFVQQIVVHTLTPHGSSWGITGVAYGSGVPFTGTITKGRKSKGTFSFECCKDPAK